jgi:hypothetical protein
MIQVRQVLQRLLEIQLLIKAEMCELHRSTIPFLGYIIAAGSVQMDPGKMRAVVNWPQPTSRVQLQRFLGFCHFYCHFIWRYNTLSALTSPKVSFTWSPAADRAFQDLKHCFTTAPILQHLCTAKRLNSRQDRWTLLFTRFNFSLSYRPGSKNGKPDALSHCYSPTPTTPECETILPTSCLAMALSWEIGKQGAQRTGCSFLMQSAPRSWSGPTSPGLPATRAPVGPWPLCDNTSGGLLSAFVATCTICAQNKIPRLAPAGLLQSLSAPHIPGLTYPWTLSWVSPHLMATPPC